MTQECLQCGRDIPLSNLRAHLDACKARYIVKWFVYYNFNDYAQYSKGLSVCHDFKWSPEIQFSHVAIAMIKKFIHQLSQISYEWVSKQLYSFGRSITFTRHLRLLQDAAWLCEVVNEVHVHLAKVFQSKHYQCIKG